MDSPDNSNSRAKWAVLAALLVLGAGALAFNLGGESSSDPAENQTSAPKQPIAIRTSPPPAVEVQPLGREVLLNAVATAADAMAGGLNLPDDGERLLIGRSFLIRLPFGCAGPSQDLTTSWAAWSFDSEANALRLRAKPENWTAAPWVKAVAADMPFEAVEGFWVRRPWTKAETCPPSPADQAEMADPSEGEVPATERQTVGLAQFFAPEGSRTMRRGARAYASTLKVEAPDAVGQYRLAITGRITGYPDGKPVHCVIENVDLAPVCVIAVEFTKIAFEDARTSAILSEWRN